MMNKIQWVVLFLLFIVCSNAQTEKVEDIVESGFKKNESGDYYNAIKAFNKALNMNPNSANAYLGRAEAKLNISETAEALVDVNKSLYLLKDNAEAYCLRGRIYNLKKKYDDALNDFNKSLMIDPTYLEAFSEKAFTLFSMNKEKEAFELVETGIKKDKKAIYYYTRGMLYFQKEKYGKTVDDLNKSIEIDPNYNIFKVNLNKGIANIALGDYSAALNDITKAILIKPFSALAYNQRGMAYYNQLKFDNAILDYNKSLELNPDNASTYYNLGMAYYKKDDNTNACASFQKSCNLRDPNACKMAVLCCSKGK